MGRAGRVMDGRCYRFVTKYFYEVSETYLPSLGISPARILLFNLNLEFYAGNIVAGTHSRSTREHCFESKKIEYGFA